MALSVGGKESERWRDRIEWYRKSGRKSWSEVASILGTYLLDHGLA